MVASRSRIGENGRVVIPARYRKALGLKTGDEVVLELGDEEVRILPAKLAVARAQRLVRKYIRPDSKLVDSLIADRRKEAERE
jgi:AbrB family looped-hinge helix DNA binding protein